MMTFIHSNETMLFWLTLASSIGFIASMVLIPWFIIRMPSDYFVYRKRKKHSWYDQSSVIRLLFIVIKNILGIVFITGGILMLFIPGQGVLTIIIGIIFTDLPFKYKIERWLIKHPAVLKPINILREKAKQKPLEI